MKSQTVQWPVLIGVAVVLMGGSFYGGMVYGKSSVKAISPNGIAAGQFRQGGGMMLTGNGARQGAGARMGGGGGFTAGDVVSKNGNGFTVKTRDGSSKIVIVASSTTIGKMTQGSAEDLSEGTGVVVTGATNSDGSITASTVQIRPAGDTGMPGFGGLGGPMEGAASGTNPMARQCKIQSRIRT